MILLDTDHFSVLTDARHKLHGQLIARLDEVDEDVCIPVISVEEQLRAWLAQIRRLRNPHQLIAPYDRLVRLLEVLREWVLRAAKRKGWSQASHQRFGHISSGPRSCWAR